VHFTGSQVIELLTPQVQVLDYCQVTLFSKMLEDSVQGKMHHLPLGTRLHRSISMGGGKRPGDGCPGFLSKMGVTIFKGTEVVWKENRYVCWVTQIQLQKSAPCLVVYTSITSWLWVWHVAVDPVHTGWYPASSMTPKCGSTISNTLWSMSALWIATRGNQRSLRVGDEGQAHTHIYIHIYINMYVYIHTYVYIYIHSRERRAYACMSVSRGGGSAECPKQDKTRTTTHRTHKSIWINESSTEIRWNTL